MEASEEAKSAERSRLFLCDHDNIDRIARDAVRRGERIIKWPEGHQFNIRIRAIKTNRQHSIGSPVREAIAPQKRPILLLCCICCTSAEGGGGFVTLLVRDGGCYRMIVNAQDCWGKSGFENRVSTEKGKNFWQRPVSRVPRWYSPDDLIEKRLCVYHRVTQKSCISDIGNVASFVKSH